MAWDAFTALTAHWAAAWGVPELVLWVIATIESDRDPTDTNTADPRAAAKGGAWGLFQVTLDTAKDLFSRVPALRNTPEGKRFDGSGRSLLDPGLSTMLGAYYLSRLWKEFGDFVPTVAAYQQGPAGVRVIVARGGDLQTELPPHGREYVARALAVRQELEGKQVA